MFSPVFQITSGITKALMSIEADRQAVADLPVDVQVLASLRETARLNALQRQTQLDQDLVLTLRPLLHPARAKSGPKLSKGVTIDLNVGRLSPLKPKCFHLGPRHLRRT